MSTDDGYLLQRNRKHKLIPLTTIPGQASRSRYFAISEFFGATTQLSGIIYIASNGFDYIWPAHAELVARSLTTYDVDSLRARNLRYELAGFQEVCDRIIHKHIVAPDLAPRWLLVLVNKVDLYINEIEKAEDYYLPGSNSDFTWLAEDLLSRLGSSSLQYSILPMMAAPRTYELNSSRGLISVPSQLGMDAAYAATECLIEKVGELSEP
jgi:hypothetical protein